MRQAREVSSLPAGSPIHPYPLRRQAMRPENASDVRRGTLIDGRYVLLARVGAGGTATVYRAQDLLLDREVAVKLLHHVLAEDDTVAALFRREADTAQRLRHDNVVRTFSHGISGGIHYIVMEHVPGGSLSALVANQAPLEPAHAIEITLQILEATRFIHNQGVIHRDLKPGNVLLTPAGAAKVTDFGIACRDADDVTSGESFLGTVHYLAPERLRGAVATKSSDLYSIGIILYELLTGRLPFEGDLVATVAHGHLNDRPVPPRRINDAVTPGLSAIVTRALEKSPQARIPDAEAFAAALRRETSRPAMTSTLRSAA
jgi:eukaryotic-like serine/threonine-protein kinase